jgi:hypothetical protein
VSRWELTPPQLPRAPGPDHLADHRPGVSVLWGTAPCPWVSRPRPRKRHRRRRLNASAPTRRPRWMRRTAPMPQVRTGRDT